MLNSRTRTALALLVATAILGATLFPTSGGGGRTILCLICGERGMADVLLNVLLFLLLGATLALRGGVLFPVLLGSALSCGIELLQIVIPGRDASPGDLLFNTLGTVAGVALVRSSGAWLAPPPRAAGRLSLAAACAALLVLAAGGWLLAPAFPRSTYYGQWTAELGHLGHYDGRVLRARVAGVDVLSHRVEDSARLRALLDGGAPIRVEAVAGPPVSVVAPIFSIYDDAQREVVLLGAERRDVVFRYRARATALRFDQPDIRLAGALRGVRDGDTLRLAVWREGREYCITAAARACSLGFTAGDTWGLLLFLESLPNGLKRLVDLGWLAALFAPAGFWAVRRRDRVLVAALTIAGLAAVPLVTGLLDTPLSGLAAAVAGLAAGHGLGRWARARRSGRLETRLRAAPAVRAR